MGSRVLSSDISLSLVDLDYTAERLAPSLPMWLQVKPDARLPSR
jgi:hypothetical protein